MHVSKYSKALNLIQVNYELTIIMHVHLMNINNIHNNYEQHCYNFYQKSIRRSVSCPRFDGIFHQLTLASGYTIFSAI
jgi:hypothetical protein